MTSVTFMQEMPPNRKITLTGTHEILGFSEAPSESGSDRRFALLFFCESDAQIRSLEEGGSLVVGREEPSEVVVRDGSISRQHARFSLLDGRVWVEDLDSRNGTFLRDRRIQREAIEAGDEITVGKARILLAATRTRSSGPPGVEAGPNEIVVKNPRMQQLYQDVARAARVNVPVLILGETGVGKEHVARAVHSESPRKDQPFVVINCAAIPAPLLESTLFGHERGSFTGANARGIGVFERAHQGVLFLDEIGELTVGAQAALLRAIETRRICRVGSSLEIPVDVRIVAATHCDLKAMVEDGAFRRDLYFRLSGVELLVPPLRERADEIEALALLFLSRARDEWGISTREVTPEALRALCGYSWPGNVRQLRHAVERSALLGASEVLRAADLPDYLIENEEAPAAASRASALAIPVELSLRQQMQRYERLLIEEALRRAGGNRQAAAKLLRVPLRTLFRKLRAAGAEDEKD